MLKCINKSWSEFNKVKNDYFKKYNDLKKLLHDDYHLQKNSSSCDKKLF